MAGTSGSDVWAIGSQQHCENCNNSEAMIAHYDGRDWRVSFSQGADVYYGIWATAPNDVWVVGRNPEYTANVLHYDGAAWTRSAPSPDFPTLRDVWASSPSDVYAVGTGVVLHYDGTAWTRLPGAGGNRIWGISREDVFIVQPDAILHGKP
jgi:hypothetical protein